jgi:2,4-dienoyl-CoA reductase (NADPH2)
MSRLTEPLRLGDATSSACLLFGPHVTNLGRERGFSARHTAYYARRAQGGAGVVVTETASVHRSDWPYERAPLADRCGPGWSEIAAAVQGAGALAIASLGHAGGQGSSAYSQAALWAPSPMPQNNDREVPKAMEADDVAAVISGFGEATAIARTAGMDGVEVNAGQWSLVRQFLSGLTNQRVDAYGEDKHKLLREVVEACRAALDGGILGLRLSADELAPWAGITPELAAGIVDAVADDVDYLVVERGSIYSVSATRPDGHTDPGFNLDLVRSLRETVRERTVLIAQGSIVDVSMAEAALDEGICDAVEMTRAQIADAELGNKVRAGDVERVRPCTLCNQRCSVRDARNPVVSCSVDPSAGWEGTEPATAPAAHPADVLVVGGGPAGLEAARAAAEAGHRVTVRETKDRVGGALLTVAGIPGLARTSDYVDWLQRECLAAGVSIETGSTVTRADLEAHDGPVLLCTGSTVSESDIPAGPLPVVDGRAALEALDGAGEADVPEGSVVLVDRLGGTLGLGLAERLAAAGRAVSLVTSDLIAGRDLSLTGDLAPGSTRLQQAGVAIIKTAEVVDQHEGAVVVEDRYTGVRRTIEAAVIVDARHREPELSLWSSSGKRHPRVGDALAPRTLHEALLEARRAAAGITT